MTEKCGACPAKPVRKAVIPAAGLGTRMLPIARTVPKEMLPIVVKPAIHHLVEEAANSGITGRADYHKQRQRRDRGLFRLFA